ncbi:hypothetical protein IT157_00665 [bacterium]|nr:hypothetical protein [bacterium]
MPFLILILLLSGAASGSEDLDRAITQFKSSEYDDAREHVRAVLLSGIETELVPALYLMIKIDLALGMAESAERAATRFVSNYPSSEFAQFAHFARAEALSNLGRSRESKRELDWVLENGSDARLMLRALNISSGEEDEFQQGEWLYPGESRTEPVADRETEPEPAQVERREIEGSVLLLLAFPDPTDPTPDKISEAFCFAMNDLHGVSCLTERVYSAQGAIEKLRDLSSSVRLCCVAGDEGAVVAVSLAGDECKCPILKLTSTQHPASPYANCLIDFLPSLETQAKAAAEYAASNLGLTHALALCPQTDGGLAMRSGFTEEFRARSGAIDTALSYQADASNIRAEIHALFTTPARLERGHEVSKAVLTREEREKYFGSDRAGDVAQAVGSDSLIHEEPQEAFFFTLNGEQINNYCSQLGDIQKGTILFGNSGWLDERALIVQKLITSGMYIVAPLSPIVDRETESFLSYDERDEAYPSAWELLALDAADYSARLLGYMDDNHVDARTAATEMGEFRGATVVVNVAPNGENRSARILRFDGESVIPLK